MPNRPSPPERIEADRLYLRLYKPGDGPMYHAAAERNRERLSKSDPENDLLDIHTPADAEPVVARLRGAWDAYQCAFYGVFSRSDDEWAGQVTVGITGPRLPEYGVGFIADARFEGKGMMTEAVKAVVGMVFRDMGGLRVRSDCSENNARSWKLLERCGFTREGHLRQNRRGPDGTVHGDYLYGILREEFDGSVE